MSPKKKELDKLQDQIRQFRPWYDDNIGGLSILKQLSTAFPKTGDVSAKSIEIRDLNTITCTGTAKDNQSLLKVTEALRKAGISDVKVNSIRGRVPSLQFTFDFHWPEGGIRAN